jgi:kynurenine formamidase
MIKFASHSGTHLDVPIHVVPDSFSLSDFSAQDFVFEYPVVVDLPLDDAAIVMPEDLEIISEKGKTADFMLFRFGYGEIRKNDPLRYTTKSPGFGVESARFIRENFPALRAIGMDVPSLACIEYLDKTMAAHNVLLEGENRRFIVVEDMNLEMNLSGLSAVIVSPLQVENIDGCPCTVFGKFDR